MIMVYLVFTDDPVNIFGYLHRCPDSLLKFFEDIFSSETTSGLFFTNDLMVLIDIVLRQVSDLSPGEEVCELVLIDLNGVGICIGVEDKVGPKNIT